MRIRIRKRLTISLRDLKNVLFYGILIFAFLKPDSLEYIGLNWLNILLVLIDGVVMLVLGLFIILKKFKISDASILILLIYGFIGLFTVLGTHDYFSLLKVVGTSFGFALFTDYLLQKKPDVYFKASITVLMILFSINLVTIFLYYPDGMYRMEKIVGDLYFMGHDNGMIYNLIPLCSLSMLYAYLKTGKLRSWYTFASLLLMFVSELYVQSATGIIEAILLVVLVVMYDNKFLTRFLKPRILISLYLIFNILIVLLRIQNYFSWFFVDILGKDLTFTGRTVLWDFTLLRILQNNFLGYGMGSAVYGVNSHTYMHCHNLLLDFLYKGGIPSFVSFTLLLALFSYSFKKTQDRRIGKLILIPLFILLFGEITSAMPYKIFFWSFFVIIQYTNNLQKRYSPEGIMS